MTDLVKVVVVLLLWAAANVFAELFVRYAQATGYSDLQVSSILLVTGAWLSAITYLIIVAGVKV